MSIQAEIDRINTSVATAYSVMEGMGATMPSSETVDNLAATAATIPTSKTYYAVCSTAAATAAKTVTVDDSFALVAGAQVTVKFTYANSVASPTLNVNGTGAKPIYRYGTTAVSTGTTTTGWIAGAVQLFTYDGTGWIRDYWNNTTYSNVSLGQGYATCSTAAATIAKTAALSSYALTANGIVAIKFTNDVPAGATLNINSKGAKAIYHKGAAITAGVIKAGDTATFIYNTYYHLISIDRDNNVKSVKDYGAKGDGSTDDSTAFENALAAERVVYVPSGTYKLTKELTIGQNCKLELEQDVLLNFTQTSGNCISMKASSNIVGNHAAIKVPYAFTGRVINIYAGLDESIVAVPPQTAWGPMWMAARYITDLHIVKLDSNGVAQSVDGACSGTAVYLGASAEDAMHFMWAIDLERLRIAGAFKYGIHMDVTHGDNLSGWIHQTRISGFIAHAEVGVYCKNATLSYISAMVLPNPAKNGTMYSKHGIVLENCTNVDLSGSRVMDWDSAHTLWTEGNEYQHIKLLGDCSGLILNEHFYYSNPNYDIRSLILTDTPSNLERLTILQEPFTRWFKPVGSEPYFNDGDTEKRLMLREELDELMTVTYIPNYTNRIPTAVGLDGNILNGTGYIPYGARWNGSNGQLTTTNAEYYGCVGLIRAKPGDIIRAKNLSLLPRDTNCPIIFYDANREYISHINKWDDVAQHLASYWADNLVETDDGFEVQISNLGGNVQRTEYVSFSFRRANIGENPIITVNEADFSSTPVGTLQDTVKVKSENILGLDEILGSYINDVDALLGGS